MKFIEEEIGNVILNEEKKNSIWDCISKKEIFRKIKEKNEELIKNYFEFEEDIFISFRNLEDEDDEEEYCLYFSSILKEEENELSLECFQKQDILNEKLNNISFPEDICCIDIVSFKLILEKHKFKIILKYHENSLHYVLINIIKNNLVNFFKIVN